MPGIANIGEGRRAMHAEPIPGVREGRPTRGIVDSEEVVGMPTIPRTKAPRPRDQRAALKADQVFVTRSKATRTPTRRIIAVLGRDVVYSDGGDQQRRCSRHEFRAWIRRYQAVLARARRPRTLVLR